jgi:uncharacterized protein YuzE
MARQPAARSRTDLKWITRKMDYIYDPQCDVLYVTLLSEKAARTVPLKDDWPMILVDVNEKGQAIGVELVGVTQFGNEEPKIKRDPDEAKRLISARKTREQLNTATDEERERLLKEGMAMIYGHR